MALRYHLTFEPDWRSAPLAFWVPAAPAPVPHKGYVFLHVDAAGVDLQFSSVDQLDHFIDVLATQPMPTSRQLSRKRGLPVGPNGHWLSRLPARLKAPRERLKLVAGLRAVRARLQAGPGGQISSGSTSSDQRTRLFIARSASTHSRK